MKYIRVLQSLALCTFVVWIYTINNLIQTTTIAQGEPQPPPLASTHTQTTQQPVVPFDDTANAKYWASRICERAPAPMGQTQVCCLPKVSTRASKRTCYPHLVVMGVQKGGTTALHSYLLFHPNMQTPLKKELHIFDFDKNFKSFPKSLFRFYRTTENPGLVVNYESTPSYIAGPKSCQRMAKYLPETTRFVVIVRNPVERVWSEIQMKARRIANQEGYFATIDEFAPQLYLCLQRVREHRMTELEPESDQVIHDIKQHFYKCTKNFTSSQVWDNTKFPVMLAKLVPSATSSGEKLSQCFRSSEDGQTIRFDREGLAKNRFLRETMPQVPEVFDKEMASIRSGCFQRADPSSGTPDELSQENPRLHRSLEAPGKSTKPSPSYCRSLLKQSLCPQCFRDEELDRNGCLKECIRPSWPSPIQTHYKCAFPILGFGAPSDLANEEKEETEQRQDGTEVLTSKCRGSHCTCFPKVRMPSDISKGFIWRGLYYYQLEQCFQHIDKSRVLVIENGELRKSPQETLNKVVEFVKLPPHDFSSYSAKQVHQRFTDEYPNFEAATGWAMGAQYDSLDPGVRKSLKEFYAKPNEKFFKLIGRRFDW